MYIIYIQIIYSYNHRSSTGSEIWLSRVIQTLLPNPVCQLGSSSCYLGMDLQILWVGLRKKHPANHGLFPLSIGVSCEFSRKKQFTEQRSQGIGGFSQVGKLKITRESRYLVFLGKPCCLLMFGGCRIHDLFERRIFVRLSKNGVVWNSVPQTLMLCKTWHYLTGGRGLSQFYDGTSEDLERKMNTR